MTDKEKLDFVKSFIADHKLAVLSTIHSNGRPQSAVVGFSEIDDFDIVIGTFAGSRKYRNLQKNSAISMVIGWELGKTVQLEGNAVEITDPAEKEKCLKVHLAKIPSAVKFVSEQQERFFKIKPTWVRYTDLATDPWDVIEIKL